MLVVDSSAWIEFFKNTPIGARIARIVLERQDDLVVPSIVVLEVGKWANRELDRYNAEGILAALQKRRLVSLDFDLAVLAAEACRQHRLATADAIVYVTARTQDAELLTCDQHFKDLPGVQYFAKDGA